MLERTTPRLWTGLSGTAVFAVREDGKLLSNHVERAALEQLRRLTRST